VLLVCAIADPEAGHNEVMKKALDRVIWFFRQSKGLLVGDANMREQGRIM
jgi:hypothetical protein